MHVVVTIFIFFSACLGNAANLKKYNLEISEKIVSIGGQETRALTVNDSIPGPTLTFTEGDVAEISVTNLMGDQTSVHWHGLVLPNFQDGVPYLTTPPVEPGKTFKYTFPLKHSGTYWYHSHVGLQEQRGAYGAIVVNPKKNALSYEHDLVLVLSDWTSENPQEVLRTLKRGSEWYSIKRKTAVSIYEAISSGALAGLLNLWSMRMPGVDISDVYYDAFLTNGKPDQEYSQFRPGERVRVRMINAAASTYFWVTFGGDDPTMVSADGMDIEPVKVPKVLHAIAETYDYIVTIPESGGLEIKAWAQDGSGATSTILGAGKVKKAPLVMAPNYIELTKNSQSMNMMPKMSNSEMPKGKSDSMDMGGNVGDMSEHGTHQIGHNMGSSIDSFSYDILKSKSNTKLNENSPIKKIEMNLTGNMWRYIWSIDGKTLSESDKIMIQRGERVQITLNNKTMMHHPMHLHGHFFRVLNKNRDYSPLKHTVDVEPMKSVTIEFEANAASDWFFHCHVLYHMKGGMARVFSYGDARDEQLKEYPESNLMNEDKQWYNWGVAKVGTQYSALSLSSSNTRNQFNLSTEYGWNKNIESDFSYDRFLGDYLRIFVGANSENKSKNSLDKMETVGTLGLKWLLPYFIDTKIRVDTDMRLQFALGTEKLLFPRVLAFGYWEITNDFGLKNSLEPGETISKSYVWNLGLEYVVSKELSIMANYENRFGAGVGLDYAF